MAEICLECWNKLTGENNPKEKYIISKDLYLCEKCGEYKNVIIVEKEYSSGLLFYTIIFPFVVVFKILKTIFKIILFPYKLYKKNKNGG